MPSGNVDKPVIEDNRDGTVSISYEPREEGLHELYIKYNGEHVQGEIANKKKMGGSHHSLIINFSPVAFIKNRVFNHTKLSWETNESFFNSINRL